MATYDREAIEAFASVFDESREQVEKIRDSILCPEISAEEFGHSWHREGDEFIRCFDRLDIDLGQLADVLGHIHDTMLENVSEFQSVDNAKSAQFRDISEGSR